MDKYNRLYKGHSLIKNLNDYVVPVELISDGKK